MAKKEEENEINWVKEFVGFIVYIAVVALVVFLIITFVGQRTLVSGNSMNDTLHDNDNLWVSKLGYHFKDPERFDIVVFPAEGDTTYYIKRIIGLPNETVRIDEDGNIYINDEILVEDYGNAKILPGSIGRAYENVKLGPDEYFVMGDNRNNSNDSRFEQVGNLDRSLIKGKAVLRIWPLKDFGKVE